MTNFRALCARMADELDHYRQLLMDDRRATHALATEARAALAQPEPQGGPTDEELWDLYQHQGRDFSPTEFARTVLARWGRPAIEPVPVSERLPEPEDCGAEGRCWFFHTSTIGGDEWFLSRLPKVSEWYRWQSVTHWLPHWALPVPRS